MSLNNASYFLMEDGSVKGCGNNTSGQLGIGNTTDQNSIVNIPIRRVGAIAGGSSHTMFLMKDGTVKGCGGNAYGQLGNGSTTNQTSIVDVTLISGVKSIHCGGYFTIFLMKDGTVKGVGMNTSGQLGLGHTTKQTSIVDIPISGVKQVTVGYSHTIFLMNNGTVKGCGLNGNGQLGLGNTTNQTSIVDIPISGVKEVAVGNTHTIFLMEDGSVKGCGDNQYGRLGVGNTTNQTSVVDIPISSVKSISCGEQNTLFLMYDGTVKGCGRNNYGQLGNGNTTNQTSIVDVPISGVKSIGCGDLHTIFLMNDGTVKGCGRNNYGQLGLGNTTDQTSIVDISISDKVLILWDMIFEALKKILIKDVGGGAYYSYTLISGIWEIVKQLPPTEQDFLNGNTPEQIAQIPESAWKQLSGEVELLYYTDDTSVEEVQFNVETEPFTLADEFEGKEVSIVEYTDNPTQEEAIVEIETEPFDFYHEMGDSVEVLYYTDDDSVTNADLEITANYSPLDDIKEDFDIVTWSSEPVEEEPLLTFNMNALPKGQLVVENKDAVIHGDVMKVVVEKVDTLGKDNGIIRLLMSFDSGNTFKFYREGIWTNINKANVQEVATKGSTIEEIHSITEDEWKAVGMKDGFSGVRFAYYIEESIRDNDTTVIDSITINQDKVTTKTPQIKETSLYILNTKSTIDINLQGRKVVGTLSDEDSTKVQYRVFLNGESYYPSNGGFTPLAEPTQTISLNIDHRKVKMEQENYLTVEFRDYWGESDFWSTTFVGEPIGLLFKDPNNGYYANEIGEVLKYLDIGTIIAGGVSIEHEVLLVNQIGYHIKNANIRSYTNESGVRIEMSKTQSPFIASDDITFEGQIDEGESVPFYIRIKTDSKANPRTGAEFQLRVYADVADGVEL